ncbi:MAG: phosphatidate cytidylyltransferase [Clostridia bacterium]|nr:phosphatidate cytidylyltransferase [Clostridia bacterium]
MSELLIRTIVAIGLIAVLALIVIFGGWVQVAALTVFSILAVIEMSRMFKKKEIHVFLVPLMLMAGLQYVILFLFPKYLPILYVVCFLCILFDRILNKNRRQEDTVATLSVMLYPLALLLCFGFFGFDRTDVSRVALMMVFAGPCMADNNAYLFGMKFGKHKLCPAISPKKTVEGFVAGLVGGPMGGILVYFLQRLFGLNVHWGWLVGLGLVGAVVGQMGDLFASTFKRWAGVKDFGSIFPKHGGVMDRLDSAMVFAPVVAVVFHYFIR